MEIKNLLILLSTSVWLTSCDAITGGVLGGTFLTIYLVAGLLPQLITTLIMSNKGYSGCLWFFLSFFLSWIGVIIALCMPNVRRQEQRHYETIAAISSRNQSPQNITINAPRGQSPVPVPAPAPVQNYRLKAIRNLKEFGQPFDEYDIELEVERIITTERELEMARKKAEYEASQARINENEETESDTRPNTKWIYIAVVCLIIIIVTAGGLIAYHMFKKANDKPVAEMSTPNVQKNSGQISDEQIQVDKSVAIQNDKKNSKFQLAVFSYEVEYFNSAAWYMRKRLDLYRNKDFKEKTGSIKGSFKDDGFGIADEDEKFTMLENRIYYYLIPEIKITKIHKHDYTDCPDFFKVGDIIKQLVYEGEGYYAVLHKGEIKYAGYRQKSDNPKKVDRSPYESCSPIEGDIIQEKEISVFVAKIKTVDNKVGWIKIICDDEKNVNDWDCFYHY
ncbi:MAG: hypothetical protein LBM08_05945 [Dysgonamonadaceae bacterium]|jgi:ABC-type antimicrobial peptide transport system permease subunit|nr:hypothetical protein [Dysgonamonadaceae bacterium]